VILLSCNFALYGSMSQKVMDTLGHFTPDIEYYSVDEAFLDFTNVAITNLQEYGLKIRTTVWETTKIPVSIGIATTKTLSKIATDLAKHDPQLEGVLNLTNCRNIDHYLAQVDIGAVWGVGRRLAKLFLAYNILNARDLKYIDHNHIRKLTSVMCERTVLELNGIVCHPVNKRPEPNKTIACTRTFKHMQENYHTLAQAVANYAVDVAERLRRQHSLAGQILTFITTNYHHRELPQYHNAQVVKLPKASNFSPRIIAAALKALNKIFKQGYKYKRAGVIASGITSDKQEQLELFPENTENQLKKEQRLMQVVDQINNRLGHNLVNFGTLPLTTNKKQLGTIKTKENAPFIIRKTELYTIKLGGG